MQQSQRPFSVVLRETGKQKDQLIGVIKKITGKGFLESRYLIEDLPSIIAYCSSEAEANEIRSQLIEVGAVATVEESKVAQALVTLAPVTQSRWTSQDSKVYFVGAILVSIVAAIVLWLNPWGRPYERQEQQGQKEQREQVIHKAGVLVAVGDTFQFGTGLWDTPVFTTTLYFPSMKRSSEGYIFLKLPVHVRNFTKQSQRLPFSLEWYLYDPVTGYRYKSRDDFDHYFLDEHRLDWLAPEIHPGQVRRGWKIFEVPVTAINHTWVLEIEEGILNVNKARFAIPNPEVREKR